MPLPVTILPLLHVACRSFHVLRTDRARCLACTDVRGQGAPVELCALVQQELRLDQGPVRAAQRRLDARAWAAIQKDTLKPLVTTKRFLCFLMKIHTKKKCYCSKIFFCRRQPRYVRPALNGGPCAKEGGFSGEIKATADVAICCANHWCVRTFLS